MSKNVLLINPTIRPAGVELLKENASVFMAPDGSEETLISCINNYEIDAVVTRVEQITERILKACPSLKIIAQHGVGVDNIALDAAGRLGVKVLNVPDANYVSVAEHTVMFMLSLSRDLRSADRNVREGNWKFRETNIPMEIAGKTVLIIGVGRIGGEVARKLSVFDMDLLGYDIYLDEETLRRKGTRKIENLEDGLRKADFVTLHVPHTELTHHMISNKQLDMMKETAYLLNQARGPVVDQNALARALRERTIAGAALDVFEEEPAKAGNPLFDCSNLIVTPHFAGDTMDAKNRCSKKLANTLLETLEGKETYNWVNRPNLII